jgi:hypothetical protein
MSDMQRYGIRSGCPACGPNYADHDLIPVPDGMPDQPGLVVLAADAKAAIAAAFRAGMEQMIGGIEQVSYDKGERDMLAKCIAAVEDLFGPDDYELRWLLDGQAVLGSLRALEEKP